jgi:hypothetical protein
LLTVLSILSRLRTMPSSRISFLFCTEREAGDLPRIEAGEGAPVVLALVQDRRPAQSGLRPFQRDELEQHAIVVHRHAPFLVVVRDVELGARPATAGSHNG